MFYETDGSHGLPHNPFKSIIVPRPIAWISTINPQGIVNLAPYSFFNGVSDTPPMVMFAAGNRPEGGAKDTVSNIEQSGEFVVNMAIWDQRNQISESSAPVAPDISEVDLLDLETVPSRLIKPPRIKASPIHMECTFHDQMDLPVSEAGKRNVIIIGHVRVIHIDDAVLVDGMIDLTKVRPLARLGYHDYTSVTDITTIRRPSD